MTVLLAGRSAPASAFGPTVQDRERDLGEKARRQQMIEQHRRGHAAEPAAGLPAPVQAPELGGARFPITQIEVRGGARHSREIDRIVERYRGATMGQIGRAHV